MEEDNGTEDGVVVAVGVDGSFICNHLRRRFLKHWEQKPSLAELP